MVSPSSSQAYTANAKLWASGEVHPMPEMKTPHTEKKFKVTISVNGQSVKEDPPGDEKIELAIHRALQATQNKDDLSLYDVTFDGKAVDVSKTWEGSGIPEKSTILVSNKPGKKAAA